MDKTERKEEILDIIKKGGKNLGDLALLIYGENLNQVEKEAFSKAIGIGIGNTFATLYEANVDDDTILRVVAKYWKLDLEEAEELLVWEKQQATIRSLEQYLKLQGYSPKECSNFLKEHLIKSKIRRNSDLWKLKDNPEKLLKAIKSI